MGLRDLLGFKRQDVVQKQSNVGKQLLNREQVDAGRMMGNAMNKDGLTVTRWRELLKSQGVNPTERLIGIAQFDLNNQGSVQERAPPVVPAQVSNSTARFPSADSMAELPLTVQLTSMINQVLFDHAAELRKIYAEHMQEVRVLNGSISALEKQLNELRSGTRTREAK